MKARILQYKNLKFEIPDDVEKPILVKWIDKKKKLVDVFEVKPKDEEDFGKFIKELLVEDVELNWKYERVGNVDKGSIYVNIPKKFWEEMGEPENFSVAYNESEKIVCFKENKNAKT